MARHTFQGLLAWHLAQESAQLGPCTDHTRAVWEGSNGALALRRALPEPTRPSALAPWQTRVLQAHPAQHILHNVADLKVCGGGWRRMLLQLPRSTAAAGGPAVSRFRTQLGPSLGLRRARKVNGAHSTPITAPVFAGCVEEEKQVQPWFGRVYTLVLRFERYSCTSASREGWPSTTLLA